MTAVQRRGRILWRVVPAASILLVGALVAACDSGSKGTASPSQNVDAKNVDLTISSNAINGGKNSAEAQWFTTFVIPKFTEAQKAKGVTVNVKFQPSGVDDEQYKAKMALDLKSRAGADIMALDGIWVGEFADAGYLQPLEKVVGPSVPSWEGWAQIPQAVQSEVAYNDKLYGIPAGTDGRILYFNKKLFAQAGLPADWQPKSWQDILDAGAKLKTVPGVTPIQINAGTAMGEATSMQGALPLLVGTGAEIDKDGKWQGNTQNIRDVLGFFKGLIDGGLMDKGFQHALPSGSTCRGRSCRGSGTSSWRWAQTVPCCRPSRRVGAGSSASGSSCPPLRVRGGSRMTTGASSHSASEAAQRVLSLPVPSRARWITSAGAADGTGPAPRAGTGRGRRCPRRAPRQ